MHRYYTCAMSEQHAQGQRLAASPVGAFVGRHREMSALQAALDDARSGRGQIVMLVGEPGIGKTSTAREFTDYAVTQGAQVAWGRCYESIGMPFYSSRHPRGSQVWGNLFD